MSEWQCGVAGCGEIYDGPETLIRHQITDHPPVECRICGDEVPTGYCSIRHAFTQHTRAEYLRAYEADSNDIRQREDLIEQLEAHIELSTLIEDIESGTDGTATMSVGD